MPVDVADDTDVVSDVGVGDVSSDTADAASPLAASVQHPIMTVTTAVKSSDASPRPWPVTVDLITQDASQLSYTGSDGWRGKGRSGRQGCGEGVVGNGPQDLGALDDVCY